MADGPSSKKPFVPPERPKSEPTVAHNPAQRPDLKSAADLFVAIKAAKPKPQQTDVPGLEVQELGDASGVEATFKNKKVMVAIAVAVVAAVIGSFMGKEEKPSPKTATSEKPQAQDEKVAETAPTKAAAPEAPSKKSKISNAERLKKGAQAQRKISSTPIPTRNMRSGTGSNSRLADPNAEIRDARHDDFKINGKSAAEIKRDEPKVYLDAYGNQVYHPPEPDPPPVPQAQVAPPDGGDPNAFPAAQQGEAQGAANPYETPAGNPEQ